MKNQNHKNVGDQRGDADEKSLRSQTPLTPLLLHGTTVSPRQHTPACGPRPRRSQQRCCARQRLKAELSPPRPVPSWLPPVAVGAGPPARFGNFPFGGGACSRSRGQPSVQAGWLRGHTSRALGCENGSATRLISPNLNRGQDTRANRTRHTTSSSTQSHVKQQHTNATRHTSRSHAHTHPSRHTHSLSHPHARAHPPGEPDLFPKP